jgi:hypothetical protein
MRLRARHGLTNWWLPCLREEISMGEKIEHKKCKNTDKIPKEVLHKIFYLSFSYPVVHWLLVISCHSCRFIAPSDVKFLCFITLSTSFSYSTADRPRRLLPGDQVIIRLGHLLSSPPCILRAHTISTCCFPFSPKLFLFPHFSSNSFLTCSSLTCSSSPKIHFCI